MQKGELFIFLKNFDIKVSKKALHEIYVKVANEPLNLDQFKQALPLFGLEHCKAKAKETKYRLRELKKVLEFPKGKLADSIIEILGKKRINDMVAVEELEGEMEKADKIFAEIEKILKAKRQLAGMDVLEGHKLKSFSSKPNKKAESPKKVVAAKSPESKPKTPVTPV